MVKVLKRRVEGLVVVVVENKVSACVYRWIGINSAREASWEEKERKRERERERERARDNLKASNTPLLFVLAL